MKINPGISKIFRILMVLVFMTLCNPLYSQDWYSMNGGMNGWVFSSTVYNGHLIIGGAFTSAGGVNTNNIASWDGTAWQPLGAGTNGKVWALTVYNGDLIAGGEFTSAGSTTVNYLARWNGSSWTDVNGDMGSIVSALTVYNNQLIVGGYFLDADGTPLNHIAAYAGGGWIDLGGGLTGSQGQPMTLAVHDNKLIAGGFFTSAGGVPSNHIAQWDGTSWAPIGTGISNIVYSLTSYNSNLIAGGLFLGAGSASVHHIASWDGANWSDIGGGVNGTFYQYVNGLLVYHGDLVAAGLFETAAGLQVNGIARWNGTGWSGFNGGFFNGGSNVNGANTLTLYDGDLIAGGYFTSAGSASVGNVARWSEPVGLNETTSGGDVESFSIGPNPANDELNISYYLNQPGNVKIYATDLYGKLISVFINEFQFEGIHSSFDIRMKTAGLATGVYLITIETNNSRLTHRVLVL